VNISKVGHSRYGFPARLTEAGLYLFAIGLPLSHVPAQFGIGFAFLGWFLDGVLNRKWQVERHMFLAVLSVYLFWNVLAAALSARPAHSLQAVVDNEWPALIMLMMMWTVKDLALLKRLAIAFLVSSSLAMVYAVWQSVVGVEYVRGMQLDWMGGYYRAVGFYSFYLTFAAFAMSVFYLSGGFALETTERRWLYASLAVVSFLAIVGSFSRSIWLALLVGVPLLGFLRNKKFGLTLTVALVIVAAVGIAVEPALRYRAESIVDVSQNQTRLNLWKTSLSIAQAHPVLGVGQDNWDYFFPIHRVEGYYDTTVHPHNDYLSVLVSSGLVGLLAFVAMWAVALREGFRTWKRARLPELRAISLGATLGLVGFLVGSMFQNYYGTFANCLGWWFLAGLVFTAGRLSSVDAEQV
jgi:O-antigen ligase